MYVCMYVRTYVYIYIYIYRDQERWRVGSRRRVESARASTQRASWPRHVLRGGVCYIIDYVLCIMYYYYYYYLWFILHIILYYVRLYYWPRRFLRGRGPRQSGHRSGFVLWAAASPTSKTRGGGLMIMIIMIMIVVVEVVVVVVVIILRLSYYQ